MLGFLEWIREVSGVDHAVHLFLDPFNDMPLLTSIEANISHEENRKVFLLIKFPLKLIYSTEWACPGKVPVQHLDIVLTDATVFEQEKYLLINKHCQRHNRPKALGTLTHSTPFVQGKSFNKLWNLNQTSPWYCLAKSKIYWEQLSQIHVTTLKIHETTSANPCNNLEKSIYQLWQIYVTT